MGSMGVVRVVATSGAKKGREEGIVMVLLRRNRDGAVEAETMMETKIGFSLPRSDSESLGLGRARAI